MFPFASLAEGFFEGLCDALGSGGPNHEQMESGNVGDSFSSAARPSPPSSRLGIELLKTGVIPPYKTGCAIYRGDYPGFIPIVGKFDDIYVQRKHLSEPPADELKAISQMQPNELHPGERVWSKLRPEMVGRLMSINHGTGYSPVMLQIKWYSLGQKFGGRHAKISLTIPVTSLHGELRVRRPTPCMKLIQL